MRQKKEKPVLDLNIYTLSGKLRKRKPKRTRTYFNEDTENAIILYNTLEPGLERDLLFKTSINDSIHKLAEFLVNTFRFEYIITDIEDLKHEMVIFSLDRFHLYDPNKGKAYSYFGTIIKRELITRNKIGYEAKQKNGSMDEISDDKNHNMIDNLYDENDELIYFIESYINFVKCNINYYFIKESEVEIVEAILDIMKNREDFKIFNKTSLFFMVKEQTSKKTPEISKVIDKLKFLYKRCLNIWYTKGELPNQKQQFDNIYL